MVEHSTKGVTECLRNSLKGIKYDLSQNILSCEVPPSLECVTLKRVAIILWQQNDIQNKVINSMDTYSSIEHSLQGLWPLVENEILSKVSNLVITGNCRKALEEIVKLIGREILKFLTSPCYFLPLSFSNRVKQLNHVVWTYQGTVNYLKTAEFFIENMDISAADKYIIACNNCLEERIRDLHGQLSEMFIRHIGNQCEFGLVLYWTYHIRGKPENFFKIVSRANGFQVTSNTNYIFKWAVRFGNEVAVQYFWKNFASEEIKESLVKSVKDLLIHQSSKSVNILCYLMLQMNKIQIEELCAKNAYELLRMLLDDDRWFNVFLPTAKVTLQFLGVMDIRSALNILFCWRESVFEKGELKRHFNEVLDKFESHIKLDFIFAHYFNLIFSKDVEIIKLFLSKFSSEDKINFMYDEGMCAYECFIMNGELDRADVFLREMLGTGKEVDKYKKFIFDVRGLSMCENLIVREQYEMLNTFLKKFVAEKEIISFKHDLAGRDGKRFINAIIEEKENAFGNPSLSINIFLNWCFDGNEKEIGNYKTKFPY